MNKTLARPAARRNNDRVRFAVTTALRPDAALLGRARAAAARHGVPCLERGGRPLASLAAEAGGEALLLLGRGAALWIGGRELRWNPGMGTLRARRLIEGERGRPTSDPFLAAADFWPGESVLDCTLGIGADALVAAAAVGQGGRVLGLEASPPLAALVDEGLRLLTHPAARRVEVRRAEHGTFLAACPERSFDVVVFDPMYREARAQNPSFDLVRRLGDPRPLSPEALARARRVARRRVLVKDGAPGWDLARLGLVPLPSARGARRLYAAAEPA
ncbi:MAG TPA: class I SAM-dependent methyltransferase [Anaeromyxobacteraceae bacterium]|nr:class I SAM-dependent methyltransferase [Anaeromyxobacteraceae bacterium]